MDETIRTCAHSWVTDTASAHPNHPDGYVYCKHCDQPYSEQRWEPPCNHDPAARQLTEVFMCECGALFFDGREYRPVTRPEHAWVSQGHEDEPRDQQRDLTGPFWAEVGPDRDGWTWGVMNFDEGNAIVADGFAPTETAAKSAVDEWEQSNRKA